MKTRALALIAATLALPACAPEREEPDGQHLICSDRFTGRAVFAFWDDTASDGAIVIGGPNYATFTLDDGRRVRLTSTDIRDAYNCRVDATRPAPKD